LKISKKFIKCSLIRVVEDSLGVSMDFVKSKVEEAAKKCEGKADDENASLLVRISFHVSV
jgi:hypothetical protein